MVKRKHGYKKRRHYRSKRLYKKIARVARGTVYKMAETKHAIWGAINTDVRGFNQYTWQWDSIAQGTDFNDRIGQKIKIKRISFRAVTRLAGDLANGARVGCVRIIVVFPRKNQNGNSVALTDFTNSSYNGYLDPTKWVVLYDKLKTWGSWLPDRYGGGQHATHYFHFSKRFPMVVNYNVTTAQKEPIVVVITDVAASSLTEIRMDWCGRTSFKDV